MTFKPTSLFIQAAALFTALAVPASMILLSGNIYAANPSFDCQKASSRVEKAICSNDALAHQDQLIAQSYQTILKTTPAIVEPSFFITSQQRWNASRQSSCEQEKNFDTCLLDNLKDRHQQLLKLLNGDAASRINMAIAMIPNQPVLAIQHLKRYPNDVMANAWLVYMSYYSPSSGISASERLALQDKVIGSLTRQDDFLAESLELAKHKNASGVFYLLRGAYDGAEDSSAYSEGCPQYFIFTRHDKAAFDAFGAQYGSSRDAQAPYCFPYNDLYNLPAWQKLMQSLQPPMTVAYDNTGTMRYATFAQFAVTALRMSAFPQQYSSSKAQQEKILAMQAIRNWSSPATWRKKERDHTLQLMATAEQATRQWLIRYRGLSPEQAGKAASGIVGTYMHLWVDWLAQPE